MDCAFPQLSDASGAMILKVVYSPPTSIPLHVDNLCYNFHLLQSSLLFLNFKPSLYTRKESVFPPLLLERLYLNGTLDCPKLKYNYSKNLAILG